MAAPEQTTEKRTSPLGMIVGFFIATVLSGGIGALYGLAMPPSSHSSEGNMANANKSEANMHSDNAAKKTKAKRKKSVHHLKPVITNLKLPTTLWIRLDTALVINEKKDVDSEKVASEAAADILAYVRTLSVSDIEGPVGLMNLRQDLQRRIRIRAGRMAGKLFITTMVVQ